jgi:hypothetical protein
MSERTRKLHVVINRAGVIIVHVCRWDVAAGETERLLSSSDGIVAIETFARNDAGAFWRIVETLEIEAPWLPTHKLARLAFYATSEPDVGAIQVDVFGVAHTFIRDRADWLDVPRYHPTYAVAPRAA